MILFKNKWNICVAFVFVCLGTVAFSTDPEFPTVEDTDYSEDEEDEEEQQLVDECPLGRYSSVPQSSIRLPASDYPFAESGLQLYTHRMIRCNGWLVEWQFIAQNKLIYGLHLGVFRNSSSSGADNNNGESSFRLVNSTFVGHTHVSDFKEPAWVNYQLPHPFPVLEGDILGIFYEKFRTPKKLLTIVNSGPTTKSDTPNTYILPVGARELKELPSNRVSIKKETVFEYRDPALIALIKNDQSTTTQSPIAAATLSPSDQFSMENATNGTEIIGNFTSSELFNGTSSLPGKAPTPIATECFNDEFVATQKKGGFLQSEQRAYPFLEAGLHIFEELRVPCKGVLVEWNFLAQSNHWLVYGLHLAVFRSTDNKQTFRIVNATYLRIVVLPRPKETSQWVTYSLPQEKYIPVEAGDYLGFYYNQFETASKLLTIATTSIDVDSSYATWVFEYDNKTIESHNNNRTLFTKDAVVTHRRAALSAKITTRTMEMSTFEASTVSQSTSASASSPVTTSAPLTAIPPKIYVNLLGRGHTVCSTIAAPTTIATFPDLESCKKFVGDNNQECNDEHNSFGACIDTEANCSFINSAQHEIYESASECYTSVDDFFTACVHSDANNAPYCSPILFNSKSCYTNNGLCVNALNESSESNAMKHSGHQNVSKTSTHLIYLNTVGRGKTVCSYKTNNATVSLFTTVELCQIFKGDNRKHCNSNKGTFGICVDSNANCSNIDAKTENVYDTAEDCYAEVNTLHNSCIHVDSEGRRFCATSIVSAMNCFIDDDTCRASFGQRQPSKESRNKVASPHLLSYLRAIFHP